MQLVVGVIENVAYMLFIILGLYCLCFSGFKSNQITTIYCKKQNSFGQYNFSSQYTSLGHTDTYVSGKHRLDQTSFRVASSQSFKFKRTQFKFDCKSEK